MTEMSTERDTDRRTKEKSEAERIQKISLTYSIDFPRQT